MTTKRMPSAPMKMMLRMRLAIALLLALAAGDAAAQEPMEAVVDSLPLPGDTVRIALTVEAALEDCAVTQKYVVRDSADVRWLQRWPQCAHADFGDLATRALALLTLFGDCHASYRIEGWRSESRRAVLLRITERYGGCRAARFHDRWLVLPSIPDGWTVQVSEQAWAPDIPWNPPPLPPAAPGTISVPGGPDLWR